jgi:hypothetical protein
MPTEGLSVVLALFGISLVGGGLYWSLRLRVQVRRRGGGSMSVAVDVNVRQTTRPTELTESTGTRPARDSERHER